MTKAEPYAQRLIAEEEVKAKHSLLGALVFSGMYLLKNHQKRLENAKSSKALAL